MSTEIQNVPDGRKRLLLLAAIVLIVLAMISLTSCSAIRRPAALPVADPLTAQIEREVADLAGQMFSLP